MVVIPMAKSKKKKKKTSSSNDWMKDAKKKKKRKNKSKKKKNSALAYYDFTLVDFWSDDPDEQLAIYQELMYDRNYREWKKKRKRIKKWKMRMREHPAKYYKKKKARKYDQMKIRKTKEYKRYKKAKKMKKENDYSMSNLEGTGSIVSMVLGIVDFASDSGILEVIFGPKVHHGVKLVRRIATNFLQAA